MAKKVDAYIKLQVKAGQANPSPPVGPALGQRGVNIMEFCKAFNAATQGLEPGMPIPVVITVYSDRSFTFITKTPPATVLLRKAAGIASGSATPNTKKVGKVKIKQKKTSNATTMSKPELAKFVKDQKEALCSGGGDKKDDKKGDDKDDKDE